MTIRENGSETLLRLSAGDHGHYVMLRVQNAETAQVELELDMPVRLTSAHEMVEEDLGKVAVERGPLVYCMESADLPENSVRSLSQLSVGFANGLTPQEVTIGGRTILALQGQVTAPEGSIPPGGGDPNALYRTRKPVPMHDVDVQMVPYFAWDNRGEGEMKVWLNFHR